MGSTIPVSQKPSSLTAQYLQCGSTFLTPTLAQFPEEHRLYTAGRGLWALGVGVVAPVGIVYHAAAFVICNLAPLFCDDKKASELALRAWCHVDALSYDLSGLWESTFFGPLALAALIYVVAWGILPLVPALATFVVVHAMYYLLQDVDSDMALWDHFARNGLAFCDFLPAKSAQANYSKGTWALAKARAEGFTINPSLLPLPDAIIQSIGSGVFSHSCEFALNTLQSLAPEKEIV